MPLFVSTKSNSAFDTTYPPVTGWVVALSGETEL